MRRGWLVCLVVAVATAASPAAAAPIEPGEVSNLVGHLQHRLAEEGFYRGPFDGEYGPMTGQAVMAFHKHLGLERTFTWQGDDWRYLDDLVPPVHRGAPGLEIDLDRQLLYYHREEGDVAIIPISSGNGERFVNGSGRLVTARTPEGEFRLRSHVPGRRVSYLGVLWKPWYFYGGYAIHGSSSVPGYPASHGCVRIPNWEADWLSVELSLGFPLEIGRSGGVQPPPPPEATQPIDRELLWTMIE
ncbi:MAG TPA: L,D-transpeptidase family protein [Acidimicrobiia bacterium]|jgi:peptidoglycan hydrolase-like protein with peptidoglycan-binding domain